MNFVQEEFSIIPTSEELIPRFNHSCCFDVADSRMIILGGKRSSEVLADGFILSVPHTIEDILPNTVLAHIMEYIPPRTLIQMQLVSKKMRAVSNDDNIWEKVSRNLMPYIVQHQPGSSFKQWVIDNYLNPGIKLSVPEYFTGISYDTKTKVKSEPAITSTSTK